MSDLKPSTWEEWNEKYVAMRIFYEDRIKQLEESLISSMKMNAKLMELVSTGKAEWQVSTCPACGNVPTKDFTCDNLKCPMTHTCSGECDHEK